MNKKFTLLIIAPLLTVLPLSSKIYRSTASFQMTRNLAPSSGTLKFKYDVITPELIKSSPDIYKDFNKNLITFIITPLASAQNYGLLDGAPGAILVGAMVARIRAQLHPHENFYKASIIDNTKALVCEPNSSKTTEFNQAFLEQYANIVDRKDYDNKSYPTGSKAAIVEFSKNCFPLDKKIKIKIESAGKSVEQGFARAYAVDTIDKKLIQEINQDN